MADQTLTGLTQGTLPNFFYGTDQSGNSRKFRSLRVFNVLDYGPSVATGGDDTTAVQAAVNAAAGGILFFPSGNYSVSKPILFGAGMHIVMGSSKFDCQVAMSALGFTFCLQGAIGFALGKNQMNITAIGPGASGMVRLTLTGSYNGLNFTPTNVPAYGVVNNTPYTVTGTTVTGIAPLNGTRSFQIVDATHIDVLGSTWVGGATLVSNGGGDNIQGGTQSGNITLSHMKLHNAQSDPHSGALYIGYTQNQSNVHDCEMDGFVCADLCSSEILGGSFGVTIKDCELLGSSFPMGHADGTVDGSPGSPLVSSGSLSGYRGPPPGSVGLFLGQGLAINCRITQFDTAYAISGTGTGILDCAAEVNNTGLQIGLRDDGAAACGGAHVIGFQTESCVNGIQIQKLNGGLISGCAMTGSGGTRQSATISNMIWSATSGGIVTVTTANPHQLTIGSDVSLALSPNPPSYIAGYGNGTVIPCHVTTSTQFTFPQTVNPGVAFSNGTWNYGSQAAILVFTAVSVVFAGVYTEGWFGRFSVDLESDIGPQGQRQNNLTFISVPMGFGLRLSTDTANRSAVKFLNSGSFGSLTNVRFQDLPGQSGVQTPGPAEGQEYDIIDGPDPAWTGTVSNCGKPVTTGGGSNHVKVRYNGTNWVIG